jgi:hypothetical protein
MCNNFKILYLRHWSIQDFAAAQARYFLACSATLQQLQKELGALSLQVSTSDITFNNHSTPGLSERRKARVICDYDSQDITELSLIAGEVFMNYVKFEYNIILSFLILGYWCCKHYFQWPRLCTSGKRTPSRKNPFKLLGIYWSIS